MSRESKPMMEGAFVQLLDGVSANGSGPTVRNLHLNRVYNITITGTATVVIEGHNGDGSWGTLATVTASDRFSSAEAWANVRATVSGYSSGTIDVTMGW